MNDRHYHYQHAASSSSTVSLASSGCHYYRDDHGPDAKPQAVTLLTSHPSTQKPLKLLLRKSSKQ